jgi:hypothetical protein
LRREVDVTSAVKIDFGNIRHPIAINLASLAGIVKILAECDYGTVRIRNFQVKGCLVEFSYIFAGTVLVSGQYDLAFSVICEIKGRLPGIAFANLIYLYSLGLTCFWCSGQSEVGNAGAIHEIPCSGFHIAALR